MRTCAIILAAGLLGVSVAVGGWAAQGDGAQDVSPLSEMDAALKRNAFPQTTSIVIVVNDTTVFERYYNGGGPAVLNNTRSATKSITALGVGAAIADGAITSVDVRAFDLLGDLAPFKNDNPAKRAITLRDLLTMSSALDCNDSDPESPGNEENMYPLAQWARWAADLPTNDSVAGHWRYCTAGTVILGRIIQNAVGEPVDRYIDRRILEPLGISEHKWFYSAGGEAMTGGGLELTSRDLAKLTELVLHRGVWGRQQVVPAEFMDDALTIHKQANKEQAYGYLFWRRNWKTRCGVVEGWYMAGNGGNAIVMFRDLNAAIVVTRTRYNTRGMHQETIRLIEDYALPAVLCRR